ncbi:hypothetical protein GMOD_00010064 [Pyrenophora seminiperda CCB06]|uniref:Uncharacterized protein n=1 Tax=Pyrenophora seminiperda CCB06 TaxID=1302712 RepID=A0A3M7M1N7_9PLEO|nr:hypothetical protein GMOD_00010064 [Pyrenophora seminiperda CCB06]
MPLQTHHNTTTTTTTTATRHHEAQHRHLPHYPHPLHSHCRHRIRNLLPPNAHGRRRHRIIRLRHDRERINTPQPFTDRKLDDYTIPQPRHTANELVTYGMKLYLHGILHLHLQWAFRGLN